MTNCQIPYIASIWCTPHWTKFGRHCPSPLQANTAWSHDKMWQQHWKLCILPCYSAFVEISEPICTYDLHRLLESKSLIWWKWLMRLGFHHECVTWSNTITQRMKTLSYPFLQNQILILVIYGSYMYKWIPSSKNFPNIE